MCVSMFFFAPFTDSDLSQAIFQSISKPQDCSSLTSLGEDVEVIFFLHFFFFFFFFSF